MRPRSVAVAFGGLVVVILGIAAMVTVLVSGTLQQRFQPPPAAGSSSSSASSTLRGAQTADAAPTPIQSTPLPVLAAAAPAGPPNPSKVRARIDAVNDAAVGARFSGTVLDVGTGQVLYGHRASSPAIPASTMKLLTSLAALSILGPDHEFSTTVVSPGAGELVLVGGGDPYLASKKNAAYPERASLADLAAATAAQLKQAGQKTVALSYDASLFPGPAWNPGWPRSYSDQVTAVSALWADEGRTTGASPGPRQADPAKAAGTTFAAALKQRGIRVSTVRAGRAKPADRRIAAVPSMPLSRIVEQLLLVSDNDAAEVVFRQAAIGAGRPGSLVEARSTVREALVTAGAWAEGTVVFDGSGLSRSTRVPASTMAKALRLAADEQHPELRSVLTGLPVAGVEGSLRNRFTDSLSDAGIGLVHGKTGTLRQVHSLAGVVRAPDGSLMVFAFLVNNARNDYAATVWLDRVTSALSRCGCR
ncbi:MAG TPA: D-alanyl-D-alanine carboxypeptidase/D-alanyl-D-alanine-endopeptidase [Propionibacteriaceae bacterium]|nr:D-alanyl-D-alanine carboxypeptidase/D-alanyl-D-alanine-endopeptidase [Propionibacteriaceae bacterium]